MEAINTLTAQANKYYAFGSYEEAADTYAQAIEKTAELKGADTEPDADVMFLYGRTLVKLALRKSEVLGGSAPTAAPTQPEDTKGEASANAHYSFAGDDAEEDGDEGTDGFEDEPEQVSAEDEFQNAWEILDLARVSYRKKLEATEEDQEKIILKKRIAETLDLLGEISLENEDFDQAVSDLREALSLKQELYPQSSSHVSGAHYMLALALEYCTSESSRENAARQVELAITSFQQRLEQMDEADTKLKDEREMLAELKLKLSDLQAPVEVVKAEEVKDIFGKEGTAIRDSLIQAMQSSNDLSTLVRKKEKKRSAEADASQSEGSKRTKQESPLTGQ